MTDEPTIRSDVAGAITRIAVAGDVDADSSPALRTALTAALAAEPRPTRLEVDMSAVDFCDAAGPRALITAWRQGAAQGTAVLVAAASPQVAGILQLTGLDKVFAPAGNGPAPQAG